MDRFFSHFVSKHAFNRQTYGQTEFSSLDRVCIPCSAEKRCHRFSSVWNWIRDCQPEYTSYNANQTREPVELRGLMCLIYHPLNRNEQCFDFYQWSINTL